MDKPENSWGLTSAQASENKQKYGDNALSVKESESFWDIYKDSFKDTFVRILCACCIITIVLYIISLFTPMIEGNLLDSLGIMLAIFLSTYIATQQDYSNSKQFNTLQAEASKVSVKVFRDGSVHVLPIDDIVKGDVIILQAGDPVPVDGVVVKGACTVNQASLNGESRDEKKTATDEPVNLNEKCEDFDNPHWLFRGSVVTSGEVYLEAVVTGDHTVLGGISESLSEEEKPTPTALKMEKLGNQIGKMGMWGAGLAVAANIFATVTKNPNMEVAAWITLLISSLSLFVTIVIMAVPEGLPTMSAIVASMNSRRMLKQHILVRHSNSIETAGYMNRLFSDKTGTITEGILSVVDFILPDGQIVSSIDEAGSQLAPELIKGIGLNNEAIASDGKAVGSNGTDRALLQYLIDHQKNSLDTSVIIEKEPFDSQKKCSRIILKDCAYLKGAPDYFLDHLKWCMDSSGNIQPFTTKMKQVIESQMNAQMDRSMRLLLIMKELPQYDTPIFLGIVCIRDNVRSDVPNTVKMMNKAGCDVVMVTGDNAATAKAIAKEAGILKKDTDLVLTSAELEAMDDEEVKRIMPNLRVVSRAKPMDKKRLVDLAQQNNDVVGMTGDGVNDSPALKSADIGFAMGDGTAVAKEASDIVIMNNSLTSIGNAVKYGRTMSRSVKKFLIFQLTVNVATLLINILAPILGFTTPFTIVQILWINLIMDNLAALAFGGEPPLDRYMESKPVSKNAGVLTHYMVSAIVGCAVYITAVVIIFMIKPELMVSIGCTSVEMEKTFIFTFFIYAVIFNAFNTRSEGWSLLEHINENKKFIWVLLLIFIAQTALIYVPGVNTIFNTTALPLPVLLWAMGLGLLIIPLDMICKIFRKKSLN